MVWNPGLVRYYPGSEGRRCKVLRGRVVGWTTMTALVFRRRNEWRRLSVRRLSSVTVCAFDAEPARRWGRRWRRRRCLCGLWRLFKRKEEQLVDLPKVNFGKHRTVILVLVCWIVPTLGTPPFVFQSRIVAIRDGRGHLCCMSIQSPTSTTGYAAGSTGGQHHCGCTVCGGGGGLGYRGVGIVTAAGGRDCRSFPLLRSSSSSRGGSPGTRTDSVGDGRACVTGRRRCVLCGCSLRIIAPSSSEKSCIVVNGIVVKIAAGWVIDCQPAASPIDFQVIVRKWLWLLLLFCLFKTVPSGGERRPCRRQSPRGHRDQNFPPGRQGSRRIWTIAAGIRAIGGVGSRQRTFPDGFGSECRCDALVDESTVDLHLFHFRLQVVGGIVGRGSRRRSIVKGYNQIVLVCHCWDLGLSSRHRRRRLCQYQSPTTTRIRAELVGTGGRRRWGHKSGWCWRCLAPDVVVPVLALGRYVHGGTGM